MYVFKNIWRNIMINIVIIYWWQYKWLLHFFILSFVFLFAVSYVLSHISRFLYLLYSFSPVSSCPSLWFFFLMRIRQSFLSHLFCIWLTCLHCINCSFFNTCYVLLCPCNLPYCSVFNSIKPWFFLSIFLSNPFQWSKII